MKLPSRRKRSNKKPLIITAAVLLVVAAGGTYWYWHNTSVSNAKPKNTTAPANTVDYGPPTAPQKSTQNQQKDDFLNSTTGDGSTPANPNTTPLSISVSRAGQTGQGQPVNVRTIVNGTASGTCTMVFTKGSTTVTKTYDITASPTSAVCNADIDINTFSDSGSWNLSVTAKNGSQTSAAATWTLTINK